MNKLKTLFNKVPGVLLGLLVILAFFSIFAEGFFSAYNIQNLMKDCCLLIIVSLGMNLCILSGRNNISVGAIMSLCGVITGLLLQSGLNMWLAIIIGILCGSFIGLISGYLIAYEGFNYWVVTYAFMGISSGIALVLSNGNTIPGFEDDFRFIGSGKIFGVYTMTWITLIICIIMVYVALKTKFGYDVYSIGGSYQTSILSGINVNKVVIKIYVICGAFAAISGIMLASKSNSASPIAGSGYEFDAIAAVLIGGTDFDGGKGKITGSIIGAILMRTLRNGLTMIGLSPYWQTFIIGSVVMGIIIVDGINQHHKKIKATRRVYNE